MPFCPKKYIMKYGWEHGKGLGKEEQGMKDAIKVKLKFDTTGVGHDPGKDFTTRWWEEQFNSAASGSLGTSEETGSSEEISSSKPMKKQKKDKKNYSNFIKTATLVDKNTEIQHETPDAHKTKKQAASQPFKSIESLADEELLKICGGRTAHKAARHGHKLNGKLIRIQKQEEEALKLLQQSTKDNNRLSEKEEEEVSEQSAQSTETAVETVDASDSSSKQSKKKKKKRRNKERPIVEEESMPEGYQTSKKLKTEDMTSSPQETECSPNGDCNNSPKKLKKKKKKKDCK